MVKNLVLYHFHACPYCAATRNAIRKLGLDIELRDILKNRKYLTEVLVATGKTQVPCLRIEYQNGSFEWMHESIDIIDFLHNYAIEESAA